MGGGEVLLYSFFNLGARWEWVVKATNRSLYLPAMTRHPLYARGGWMGPETLWTGAEKLASTGFDTST